MRSRSPFRLLVFSAFGAASLTVACGGSPTGPSNPPPVDAPRLTCPADQSAQTTSSSATVSYPPPAVAGGQPPVSISCTPASGSSFPSGKSTATCTATDSLQRTAQCSFAVTVDVVPQLRFTRFVAFGDSITEGKLATGEPPMTPYPTGLRQMLAARYATQEFTVVNAGLGAETTGGGVGRLPSVLNANNPQVLLLFEGVNDLAGGNASAIGPMISSLGNMIGQARGRGVVPMLATLLPEIFGGQRAGAAALIVPANDQIRVLAGAQGVALVDLYNVFRGSESTLIGQDGLHPTEAGYQAIAQTFFTEIRNRYEGAPTPTFTDLGLSRHGVARRRAN